MSQNPCSAHISAEQLVTGGVCTHITDAPQHATVLPIQQKSKGRCTVVGLQVCYGAGLHGTDGNVFHFQMELSDYTFCPKLNIRNLGQVLCLRAHLWLGWCWVSWIVCTAKVLLSMLVTEAGRVKRVAPASEPRPIVRKRLERNFYQLPVSAGHVEARFERALHCCEYVMARDDWLI